jgi:hypothetical protein
MGALCERHPRRGSNDASGSVNAVAMEGSSTSAAVDVDPGPGHLVTCTPGPVPYWALGVVTRCDLDQDSCTVKPIRSYTGKPIGEDCSTAALAPRE